MREDSLVNDSSEPMRTRPIRVALVDDQPLVRSGVRMMIESEPDVDVVGEAEDGEEAVELLQRLPVDVVLMDIRMPHMDGIEATRRIMAMGLNTKVIMLTTYDLDDYVYEALRYGASGFLLKDARATELVDAIRAVDSGDAIIAPATTRRLLANLVPMPDKTRRDPRLDRLTEREMDVLKEVANGWNNAEICERLHLAEGTVKANISRLLSKLDIRDRVGLVMLGYDQGLVDRDRGA